MAGHFEEAIRQTISTQSSKEIMPRDKWSSSFREQLALLSSAWNVATVLVFVTTHSAKVLKWLGHS